MKNTQKYKETEHHSWKSRGTISNKKKKRPANTLEIEIIYLYL